MCRIERIHAREVFDSRGRPTVEVEVTCGGRTGRAIVPSGASTGRFEAAELRDDNPARLGGSGVLRAVEHVRGEITCALLGSDASNQQTIDRRLCELDGTEHKSRLGANALLGVSLAAAYAAAAAQGMSPVRYFHELWQRVPSESTGTQTQIDGRQDAEKMVLPVPMVNMISGALHAGGNLDFQDFLILPVGAGSLQQAVEWVVTVYHRLGRLLCDAGHEGRLVGDEGGYGPRLASNSEAVEFLMRAIESAGLRPGDEVAIGLDVAATHFYEAGQYRLKKCGSLAPRAESDSRSESPTLTTASDNSLTPDELIHMLETWARSYPILSIEDGLAEDDWTGWKTLTERLGHRVQLIGDDLFVTHGDRLKRGIELGTANSVLIKPNQIGTLWETLQALRLAKDHGYRTVISARSGETEDTTIADLAVATAAGQIKIGSVARSERLAKYNQLLRLEEQLGPEAVYLGGRIFADFRKGDG